MTRLSDRSTGGFDEGSDPSSSAWRKPPDDEAELLARSLRHDREAFGLLVERYASSILNVVARMVGDGADAQDLTQETFLAAFKALPAFRAEAKFSTWLYRIAINKCKDWLRTHRAGQEQESMEQEAEHRLSDRVIEHRTPDRIFSQKELADQLDRAIRTLPPLYREAFILKHVEGLSYEEISDILGVNRDVLKMRVYKARTRLSQELVELWDGG